MRNWLTSFFILISIGCTGALSLSLNGINKVIVMTAFQARRLRLITYIHDAVYISVTSVLLLLYTVLYADCQQVGICIDEKNVLPIAACQTFASSKSEGIFAWLSPGPDLRGVYGFKPSPRNYNKKNFSLYKNYMLHNMWPLVLGQKPLKCQERPCGVHKMQQTPWTAGAPPLTPLGELTALPRPLAGGEGAGCPLFKNPTTTLGLSGLGLQPFGPRLSPSRIFKPPPKWNPTYGPGCSPCPTSSQRRRVPVFRPVHGLDTPMSEDFVREHSVVSGQHWSQSGAAFELASHVDEQKPTTHQAEIWFTASTQFPKLSGIAHSFKHDGQYRWLPTSGLLGVHTLMFWPP